MISFNARPAAALAPRGNVTIFKFKLLFKFALARRRAALNLKSRLESRIDGHYGPSLSDSEAFRWTRLPSPGPAVGDSQPPQAEAGPETTGNSADCTQADSVTAGSGGRVQLPGLIPGRSRADDRVQVVAKRLMTGTPASP
jgi:hypothetical protein